MSLQAVSAADIRAQIVASVELEIGQAVPLLPKAFVRVLAAAFAGVLVLLYKYCGWIFLQLFVTSASAKATTINGVTITPLNEWGELVGVGLPVAAVAAELEVEVTVTSGAGTINANTQFVSQDNGVTYLATAAVPYAVGTVVVPVQASGDQEGTAGAGSIGNLDVGALMYFAAPIPGVNQAAVVSSTLVQGADAEETEEYRQRVLDRFQKQPQGGALADYEAWAEETAGIVASYPYPGNPGTVRVYSRATEASSGSADGVPTAAQLLAVSASIDLDLDGRATRRPVSSFVYSLPITRKTFRVRINGLEVEDDVQVKADVEAALRATFDSFEPYIGGLSIYKRERVTRSEIAGVVHGVVAAAGGTFGSVLLYTQPITPWDFAANVVESADDADEAATVVTLTGTSVTLGGTGVYAGFRFEAVTLPAGAVIKSARIDFEAAATNDTYSDLTIRGHALAASPTFTTGASNISARAVTVAETNWIPPKWTAGVVYQSPDISAIVDEIRSLAGWASGGPMTFVVTGTADSNRTVKTWDDGVSVSAELILSYDIPAIDYSTVEVYALREGELAKLDTVTFA